MKKIKVIVLVIFLCVFLCSCWDDDPYRGERPIDFPNSYWVCEEYKAHFLVDENKLLTDTQITIQGKKLPFSFLWWKFDNRVSILFEFDSPNDGMIGYCEFDKNEFTITIDDTKGYYPEEKIVMEFERKQFKT